jgi:hypothetical protein
LACSHAGGGWLLLLAVLLVLLPLFCLLEGLSSKLSAASCTSVAANAATL